MNKKNIYMHTFSGLKYYPFNPKPEDVRIEDIAHHLSTKGRWNGATRHKTDSRRIIYSVAEHSVYVSLFVENELMRPDLALEGLLHDASEAYNGDLIRPLKYSDEFREPFKKVERVNEIAVAKAFGLPENMSREVKIADDALCAAEYDQIIPRIGDGWDDVLHDRNVIANIEIQMLDPFDAKIMFMNRYKELCSR